MSIPTDAQRPILWEPAKPGDPTEYHYVQDFGPWPKRQEFTPTTNRQSQKFATRARRILDRLRQGPATTWELMQLGGAGFSSRIAELRRDGWNIPTPEMHEDYGVYRLEKPVDEKDRTAL